MWLSAVVVWAVRSLQLPKLASVEDFCAISQWLMVPLPVTDEVTRSFWLPAFAATGLAGVPGLVRKLPLTTSVAQVLSL